MEVLDARIGPDSHPAVAWDVAGDVLRLAGAPVRPAAVFCRQDVFSSGVHRAAAWYTTVTGWALAHPEVRMLNRGHQRLAPNKPAMLHAARAAGLGVADTLVTNDLREVADLRRRAELVVKPVEGGEYTQSLDDDLVAATPAREGVAPSPALVQRLLVPPELRLFGAAGRWFGFRVESAALDYRTDPDVRVLADPDVPAQLIAGVGRLMEAHGLDFAAADFKSAADGGGYRFLELNSWPMFAAFDRAVGGELAGALLDWLIGPA